MTDPKPETPVDYRKAREDRDTMLESNGYSRAYTTATTFGISEVDLTYCKNCGATILLPQLDPPPALEHPLNLHLLYCPASLPNTKLEETDRG